MSLSRHIVEFIGRITTSFKSAHYIKAHCQPWCLARAKTYLANFLLHETTDSWLKGFSKHLLSVRTAQAIRSKKIVIRSSGSGYPFEKEMSSVRTARVIHLKQLLPALLFQIAFLSPEPFAKNLSKNVCQK